MNHDPKAPKALGAAGLNEIQAAKALSSLHRAGLEVAETGTRAAALRPTAQRDRVGRILHDLIKRGAKADYAEAKHVIREPWVLAAVRDHREQMERFGAT